ncbi:VCBS repeat-containing protein, partial [candidate division WOR-3 bacterium]|nr:VCBS repeat-containing protein [candidate division WOR-3 bacterium]
MSCVALLPACVLGFGIVSHPTAQVLPDTVFMPIVASFSIPGLDASGAVLCGDADRDGRNELYVEGHNGPDYFLRVYEHVGGNSYAETTLVGYLLPGCAGDADRDGLFDVVGSSYDGHWIWLSLLESPDSFSLPRDTSIFARGGGVYAGCITADLDLDSLTEIVVRPGFQVRLLECSGNNAFSEIALLTSPDGQGFAGFRASDIDRDGKPELLVSSMSSSWFFIYEAAGNNEIQLVAVCTTDVRESRELAIADDMDQDGRK